MASLSFSWNMSTANETQEFPRWHPLTDRYENSVTKKVGELVDAVSVTFKSARDHEGSQLGFCV